MDWKRVGRYVTQRIDDLRLTKAEVQRRAGVSDKTLSRYMAGEPIVRVDKERELCQALGWTSDSVRRIGAGEEPVELDADDERLTRLEGRVDRVESELRTTLAELRASS